MSPVSEHGLWAPVADGARKDKSEFGRLPRGLRDEVIAGLDNGTLTLEDATAKLDKAGHTMSRSALGAAYFKLRRARRRTRNQESLSQLIADFSAQPTLKSFESLAKLLTAQAAEALLNDEESKGSTIKAAARALETMTQLARVELERERLRREDEKEGRKGEPESVDDVLEQVYGIGRK